VFILLTLFWVGIPLPSLSVPSLSSLLFPIRSTPLTPPSLPLRSRPQTRAPNELAGDANVKHLIRGVRGVDEKGRTGDASPVSPVSPVSPAVATPLTRNIFPADRIV